MDALNKYFAILGREPELSAAELMAVAVRDRWHAGQWQVSASAAVWEGRELDLREVMASLGGTVKLGEVAGRLPVTAGEGEMAGMLGRLIEPPLLRPASDGASEGRPSPPARGGASKIRFGVSAYDFRGEDSPPPSFPPQKRGGTAGVADHVPFGKGARSRVAAGVAEVVSVGMRSWRERLRKIALGWKKEQRDRGRSVRFVDTPDPVLSSVSVVRNRLVSEDGPVPPHRPLSPSLRRRGDAPPSFSGFLPGEEGERAPQASPDWGVGVEVVVLVGEHELLFGRTVAVQGFAEYSARDYGRPERDDRSGMLPPKLAQIMLNLSGVMPADAVLLDPFCGSGTVLQEALLLGWGRALGSDLSGKAVHDSQGNLQWLTRLRPSARLGATAGFAPQRAVENFSDLSKGSFSGSWEVRVGDARKLDQVWPRQQVDAIVTEPYLGPPEGPGRGRRQASQSEGGIAAGLVELYRQAFQQFARVLRPGGVVVMVLPVRLGRWMPLGEIIDQRVWAQDKSPKTLSDGRKQLPSPPLKKGGESPQPPLKKGGERQTLLYGRPGQAVRREIGVWRLRATTH